MKVDYTAGSFYRRLRGSFAQRLNRDAVERYRVSVANSGPLVFNARLAQSQGMSELAARQLIARVQQEAAARAASAGQLGNLLDRRA